MTHPVPCNIDMTAVCKRLHNMILSQYPTVRAFVANTSICKNTIYRMLNKRVLPSIPVLVEMCENLGCSVDFLLGLYSPGTEAREAYVTTVLNIKAFWTDWPQEDRLTLIELTSDLLSQSRKPVC